MVGKNMTKPNVLATSQEGESVLDQDGDLWLEELKFNSSECFTARLDNQNGVELLTNNEADFYGGHTITVNADELDIIIKGLQELREKIR